MGQPPNWFGDHFGRILAWAIGLAVAFTLLWVIGPHVFAAIFSPPTG